MHRAAYPFKHENSKILSFKTRDLFLVLKENDNGWWLCLAQNGRIGLVPGNYIEPFKVSTILLSVIIFFEIIRCH